MNDRTSGGVGMIMRRGCRIHSILPSIHAKNGNLNTADLLDDFWGAVKAGFL